MKKILLILIAGLLANIAGAAETNSTPQQIEAKYSAAIESRTAAIFKILALTEADKTVKVHDAIIAQYRALNAWHDANDAKLKATAKDTNAVAQIRASLKTIHEAFLAKLSESLTPSQVEQVKDQMTYNKVRVTYDAYCEIIPALTDAQKAHILELLKAAREESRIGRAA